jgi:hypothetical protein
MTEEMTEQIEAVRKPKTMIIVKRQRRGLMAVWFCNAVMKGPNGETLPIRVESGRFKDMAGIDIAVPRQWKAIDGVSQEDRAYKIWRMLQAAGHDAMWTETLWCPPGTRVEMADGSYMIAGA